MTILYVVALIICLGCLDEARNKFSAYFFLCCVVYLIVSLYPQIQGLLND
jgi:hypothetical protein